MTIDRHCAECGTPFTARHPLHLTCGPICSRKRRNRSDDYHRWKRSQRRAITGYSDITPQQEAAMRKRTRKCPLCAVWMTGKHGRLNSKELDHIVPLCVGGTHTHGNVRIICRLCNLRRPKDGSDYSGPVTLWAQVPGVALKPKPAPRPCPAPKPASMATCAECGTQFAQRNHRQTRCADCMTMLGMRAAELRREGVLWEEIAQVIGYTVGGAYHLAQRRGLYARSVA